MILASLSSIRSLRPNLKEMYILSNGKVVQVIWISIRHRCLRLLKEFMVATDRKRA